MLTEQHTEIRRDGRGVFLGRGKTNAGVGRICADYEFNRRFFRGYNKGKLVFIDLGNAVDLPALEESIQFLDKPADMESVLGHDRSSSPRKMKSRIYAGFEKSFLKLYPKKTKL